jgi:hypothetical protein
VFASKSIKSHIETQIYRTNNAFKVELRKMINYKDDQPGPGHYEVQLNGKVKSMRKYQFFGSTVERFPSQMGEAVVGPGSYYVAGHLQHGKEGTFMYCKEGGEERDSYIPKNIEIPGPGSYEVDAGMMYSSLS